MTSPGLFGVGSVFVFLVLFLSFFMSSMLICGLSKGKCECRRIYIRFFGLIVPVRGSGTFAVERGVTVSAKVDLSLVSAGPLFD